MYRPAFLCFLYKRQARIAIIGYFVPFFRSRELQPGKPVNRLCFYRACLILQEVCCHRGKSNAPHWNKIENKVNGKVYIGQSVNVKKRFIEHRYRAYDENDKKSYGLYLYVAIRKYGIENFSFMIIEECPKEKLNERERFWIQYYMPLKGWNQERRLKYEQVQ